MLKHDWNLVAAEVRQQAGARTDDAMLWIMRDLLRRVEEPGAAELINCIWHGVFKRGEALPSADAEILVWYCAQMIPLVAASGARKQLYVMLVADCERSHSRV
jgi:hypothetical protein